MSENHVGRSVGSKSAKSAEETNLPSLIEMIRGDRDLRAFFKLVRDRGMREQAIQLLKHKTLH